MPTKTITCIRCKTLAERSTQSHSMLCLDCTHAHNRECWVAILRVRKAVRQGLLAPVRQHLCADCGARATEYEHRDYTKPLDVQPVCRRCNAKRGVAFDSKYRPQPVAA